jgi:carboxymethylenebutenolidase
MNELNEMTSIPGESGAIEAYICQPSSSGIFPTLIVIEEIWGLTDHIKDVCDRFAQEGFLVIAPELLDNNILENLEPTLYKESKSDDANIKHETQSKLRAAMAPNHTKEFFKVTIARLQACVDYALSHRDSNGAIGVVGFSFGGTYAFQLAIHDARIRAVVPFYGIAPDPLESVAKIQAPILTFYGEADSRIISSLPALVEAMKNEGRDFSYMLYPHAGQAFFNDTNKRAYHEDAARDAWEKTLSFLHAQLENTF